MTALHGAGCLCQACTRERLAVGPTMGERCSVRRQLAGAAMAIGIGLAVVAGVNAAQARAMTYGSPGSPNGGLVVDIGNSCIGVELWGHPGLFGSLTDAGACDI